MNSSSPSSSSKFFFSIILLLCAIGLLVGDWSFWKATNNKNSNSNNAQQQSIDDISSILAELNSRYDTKNKKKIDSVIKQVDKSESNYQKQLEEEKQKHQNNKEKDDHLSEKNTVAVSSHVSSSPSSSSNQLSTLNISTAVDASDYCFQESPSKPLLQKRHFSSAPKVRDYMKNVILMHMVSPSRYSLIPLIFRHYSPYFVHQIFTGPKNDSSIEGVPELDYTESELEKMNSVDNEENYPPGSWKTEDEKLYEHEKDIIARAPLIKKQPTKKKNFTISGHDVVFGTMQYVALADIIDKVENMSPTEREENGFPANPEGYMFLGDDLMMQPWMLHGRNKNVAWCSGMGIANSENWRPVKPVPAMSAEKKAQKGNWPFWFAGRVKMVKFFNRTDVIPQEARDNLARAADLTPPTLFAHSRYVDPERRYCCEKHLKERHMFYTIVDNFYVPAGKPALQFSKYSRVAREIGQHLETAIPTMLRMISPSYEVLRLQYYWSSVSGARCKRHRWSMSIDGFHRCRHDHIFSRMLYDETKMTLRKRIAINANGRETMAMKALDGLDTKWDAKGKGYSTSEFDVRMTHGGGGGGGKKKH